MEVQFLVFLFISLVLPTCSDKGAFSYVVSSSAELDPVYGVRLDSTVPAVDLALEYINNNSTLLPDITLSYGQVTQLQCNESLDDLLTDNDVGLLGYSCHTAHPNGIRTKNMTNFTPMIQYTAAPADFLFSGSESSDQQAYLFSIHPSPRTYAEVVVSIMEQFGWQRFLTVTNSAGETFFTDVLESITSLLQDTNITLFEFDTVNSTAMGEELLTIPLDVRIVFLNINSSSAVQIMCEASRAGHLFPRYVWIAYAGDYQGLAVDSTCDGDELAQFLEGVFTLLPTLNNETDLNIFESTIMDELEVSHFSYFAFDAVLVLAQAINDTQTGWSNNSPDWSFCEHENEVNRTSLTKCFIRRKIQNINIAGLTGEISFNTRGNRVTHIVGLYQFRVQDDSTGGVFPTSELIAVVTVDASDDDTLLTEFELLNGENTTTIFMGPVPHDGTPLKHINTHPLPLVIVYYTIASIGIVFALVCFLFNIIFRNRRIVKLISPNLNYFIILGAIMLYGLIFARVYSKTFSITDRCNVATFLTVVGYTLCFGPVLMKMFRVYYIFHNPSANKKVIRDWHLILGAGIMVGIALVIVVIGIVTPTFKPEPRLIRDVERPGGVTEDGIRVENRVYQCYGSRILLVSLWVAIQYIYLFFLQLAAFVLAILTRKVKINVLNDSKEMLIIVYSTSAIAGVLAVLTFAVDTRLIVGQIFYCGLIMVATTIFLTLVFIPKMIYLCKDPRGEDVFGQAHKNNSTSASHQHKSTVTTTVKLLTQKELL